MNKQSCMEMFDSIYDVICKLSVIRDFTQTLDGNNCLSKLTPNGLSIYLSDCIETLARIGGFNEQTAD
jgi:hypothetical protein